MKILLVDDNIAILDSLEALLVQEGHTVHVSVCGYGALAVIQQQPQDIIVLDYLLPAMNGVDFLIQLRKMRQPVPVIFLTAVSAEDIDDICRKTIDLGPLRILRKPTPPDALLHVIEEMTLPAMQSP